ncbi:MULTISPECIES: hydantoinase B/oxoprolinase family protein [unclassified Roseitalea]|uniref:hydantoinase B/oxoprolinase family protein n=1 Tax=unclassified Roseitalea TaxID=2639107 RepID=UPI00273DAF15|nr:MULTISPECIES: hydantoinase B/oxoprolinase family protein [unclassified Roseitalea]
MNEVGTIDGGLVEILRASLGNVAEEMRTTLIRTAFSPVIYEVLDFGISIYDAKYDLIAEAPGLTRFLGANDFAVPTIMRRVGPENVVEGDVIVANYPYWNAAHVSDASLIAPVFAPGRTRPFAWLCVRAHWIDLGAKDPGYVLDSTDMYQEGLVLPGIKLVKAGVPDAELLALIRFNSRMPERLMGDIHAQLAALATGTRRMAALIARYGADTLERGIAALIAYGEAVVDRALADLPEGRWSAEDWLDGDGIDETPIPMKVTVTHADGRMSVDFDGSSPAVRGPVNLPFGSTMATAKVAFKALTSPGEPSNAGHMRALTVKAEPGTLFHAVYPAPTFTQWAGIVALELIFAALAKGMPDRIQASSGGDVPGFMMIGTHPDTGERYALSNNESVGWGATSRHDGRLAGSHLCQSVVRNTPIEVLETRTAMRVDRFELRPDSFGDGRYRGGPGLVRDLCFTAPGEFLTIAKKTGTRPWSIAGGGEPEPTRFTFFPGTPRERRAGTWRAAVAPGDRVRVETAGGAGHGPARRRDSAAMRRDIEDGLRATRKAAP